MSSRSFTSFATRVLLVAALVCALLGVALVTTAFAQPAPMPLDYDEMIAYDAFGLDDNVGSMDAGVTFASLPSYQQKQQPQQPRVQAQLMQGTLEQAQAAYFQSLLNRGYSASPVQYPSAYGAIYRTPKTVRVPVQYERAAVPVMASTTTSKQAAPMTREPLQERASPVIQAVTPRVQLEQAPVQYERAKVPLMTSTTTTKQASPIVREALTERAAAIREEVQVTAPKVEEAPVQYERATVPLMTSTTTTTTSKQTEVRAPITETAAPVLQTVQAEPATFEQAPVQYERATVPPVAGASFTQEQASPVVQPAVYEQREPILQQAPASSSKKTVV